MVLALWKLAAVVEGAYANLVVQRDDRAYTRGLEKDVPALLRQPAAFAEQRGCS